MVLSKTQGGNTSRTKHTLVTTSNEDFYDRNVIVKKKKNDYKIGFNAL